MLGVMNMAKKLFITSAITLMMAAIIFAGWRKSFLSASAAKVLLPPATLSKKPVLTNQLKAVDGDGIFDLIEFDGKTIDRSDDEWRKILTPEQFYILRQGGTERPYTGALTNNHERGVYYCAACGLALFRSKTKFESGTGWPSFYEPIYKKNVVEKEDRSLPEETRTEIFCARCHSHLGHVFDDGPPPTGLRYCMNSLALKFKALK
jgi:peptide-methionine (R)-S-oxide reductase